ncbi:hypothetical protein [Solemya velesiana gill symbiont]|uniref:PABS domain-containing protein n=1 Tax=Solemya velesiana gill symbiont TaxID=1918948 RepID=A0A1T2KY16_9GAMM|nr:hypothetical protein [Solemya velesiana gill symbiont]OOZ37723.1 hypothetical protein BOW51_00900 [Solemya velesiana gill symbiont]
MDVLEKEPFIFNQSGEQFLFSANREDFSAQSSADVYREAFGDSLFNESSFYLIIGTDSGLLPAFIATRGIPRGTHYYFLESPAVLERLNEKEGVLDTRFHFSTLDSIDSTLEQMSADGLVFYLADDTFQVIPSLAARHDYLSEYALIQTATNERLKAFA